MYMAAAIDIPNAVINDFADYWRNDGLAIDATTLTRDDLRVVVRRCLEAYVNAIMVEGIPPLDMSDPMMWQPRNRDLRAVMYTDTGLSADLVDEFLYNLWEGAKTGQIDPKWLTPATVTEIESEQPPSYWSQLMEQIAPGAVVEGATKQLNKTLLLFGAGVVIFMLGREIIRRKL